MLPFWVSFPKSSSSDAVIFSVPSPPARPRNHTKPMDRWLLTLIFSARRGIHPQCLLNFENIFYPLLDGCQNTFLPEIVESSAICRQILTHRVNSNKLLDHFWSMTHHGLSIYMNTPLSICGLKGVFSLSTVGWFYFMFYFYSFSLCVSSMVNDQFLLHLAKESSKVKHYPPSFLLALTFAAFA